MTPETEAELIRSLGRIEGKVDGIDLKLIAHIHDDGAVHGDMEKRLRAQEGWRWRMTGAATLVSGLVAMAIEWVRGSHG